MGIDKNLERIREELRQGKFTSEASVSLGIIIPTLRELGWPVFDTSIVIPEFSIEGRRVDYALCHPANRPSVFIEVKRVGLSEGADRQLFEYAFHQGVPMAILTDGQEWRFYLPSGQGRYEDRIVYKLDLIERSTDEAEKTLKRYLSYDNVCSGDALEAASSDYQNVARHRVIENFLPKAWTALIREQDSLLLEMLSEKVADLCGYKPDLDICSQFLEQHIVETPRIGITTQINQPTNYHSSGGTILTRTVDNFSFSFKGKDFSAGSARQVMTKIFQLLAKEDSGFLERFASRKHGKKRRYLAKNKLDLYPGRPDLAEHHSVEVAPGWWLTTNYSRQSIQKIIDLALEVAGPRLKSTVQVNVIGSGKNYG